MIFESPKFLLDHALAVKTILIDAVKCVDADRGALMLFNPTTGGLDVEAMHGFSAKRVKFNMALAEKIARAGESLCVDNGGERIDARAGSEMAVSLEQDGQSVGLLYVCTDRKKAFVGGVRPTRPRGECEFVRPLEQLKHYACGAVEWLKIVWEIDQL